MRYECSLSTGNTWNTPCVLCTLASALWDLIDPVHTSSTPVFYGALRSLTIPGQLFNPDVNVKESMSSVQSKSSPDACHGHLQIAVSGTEWLAVHLPSSFSLPMVCLSALPQKSVRQFQCGVTHHWTDSR